MGTHLVVNLAFFQSCHSVPHLRIAAHVVQSYWSRLVCEELWLSCLHNNHVKELLPVFSDYVPHALVPARTMV
jgi:hypothetical protein